jgi:hypothetical protein
MRSKLALVAGFLAFGMIAVALPAGAHHAHGNYALEYTDFEGVVTELHALNPHSFIYVKRTMPSGETQQWALEIQGLELIRKLEAQGKGLKVGDKVKARCHLLRDGSPGCLMGYIKHPDGNVYDYDKFPPNLTPITTLAGF